MRTKPMPMTTAPVATTTKTTATANETTEDARALRAVIEALTLQLTRVTAQRDAAWTELQGQKECEQRLLAAGLSAKRARRFARRFRIRYESRDNLMLSIRIDDPRNLAYDPRNDDDERREAREAHDEALAIDRAARDDEPPRAAAGSGGKDRPSIKRARARSLALLRGGKSKSA
jgi:hypothetical protein